MSEILYYLEVNKLAAEVLWMLVEDPRLLDQKQKKNMESFTL